MLCHDTIRTCSKHRKNFKSVLHSADMQLHSKYVDVFIEGLEHNKMINRGNEIINKR